MALQGFDEAYYLGVKLAALQATYSEWSGKTTADLKTTLATMGYTPEQHYVKFGYAEKLNPNAYFNGEQYTLFKAQALFDAGLFLSIADAKAAFLAAWPGNVYDHYLKFGGSEGVNPSNSFDSSEYLASKLAQLQAADPTLYGSWTTADVAKAIKDAGMTPLTHFLAFGEAEGISATSVPADEQVSSGGGDTPGESFVLTENIESVSGNSGDNAFLAYSKFTAVGQVATLQSGDSVDGKDGNDSLTADLFGGTIVPTLTNVENLILSDYSPFGSTVNLSNTNGLNSVEYKLIVDASTLDAVGNVVGLAATNITGDRDLTVNYLPTALAGDNTQMMAVGGADLDDVVFNGAGALETVSIYVGTGESSIDGLSGTALDDAMTKVVITGEGKLSANLTNNTASTAPNTKLTTVDASAATGDLSLTVGVALNQNITGGKGNDTFTMGTFLTKDDTVDGGEGNDTLSLTGNVNAASYSKVTNVETVVMAMNGNDANVTNELKAGAFAGLSKAVVQLQTNLTTNSDDALVSSLASTTEVVVQDMVELTAGASDGTVDDITVNGANVAGTSDVLNFSLNAKRSSVDLTVNDLVAAGYETINVTSTGAASANADIENIITNGITNIAIKTLNVKGDRELILGGATAATTIDASAMTAGGVSIGLGAAEQKVTGSTLNDSFTIAYGNLTDKDTINGGDGTDTLVLAGGGAAMSFAGATNSAKLKNVSGFEQIGLGAANDSLVLDDISMNSFTGAAVAISVTADVTGTGVDVSNVKSSTASVTVNSTKITTAGNTFAFNISNGKDVLTGGDGTDIVLVSDAIYLASSDVLTGGAGNNNVFFFHDQDGVAETNTYAASQFSGVSGFNTMYFTDDAAADTFDITLDNAAASGNAHSATSILTIDMFNGVGVDNTDDTLKLDASSIGAAVKLVVTGGNLADTLKLGAGDDTVDGGAGTDTISLGGGKNVVVVVDQTDGAAGSGVQHDIDTISGFNFGAAAGKSDANIDKIDLTNINTIADLVGGANVLTWDALFDTVQVVNAVGTATAADTDVLVLAHQGFTDASAIDTYLEAANTGNVDGDLVVVYQDTLGNVRVSLADGDNGGAESAGADYVTTDLMSLTGVTIAGVKDNVDTGDFVVA